MKKILLVACVLPLFLLTGCMMYPQYVAKTTFIDVTKYTDDGFFLTQSNSVPFEYKTIGIVNAVILDGVENEGGAFVPASEEDILYNLCEKSMLQKANGLINLSITPYYDVETRRKGLVASGMAIRRL